jgi:predicted nucleic-acid-binding Zn-ribbon protein
MIMRDIPIKVKCPQCGSENIETKWSLTTIVAWVGRILGVPAVKIFEKKCVKCGHQFQIFKK